MAHWFSTRPDADALKAEYPHAFSAAEKAGALADPSSTFRISKRMLPQAKADLHKLAGIYGAHYPRIRVSVSQGLMQQIDHRNAVNYLLAKAGVPCYFHTVRQRKGGSRVPVAHCTWFHDGEWFLQKPVSDLDTIIATGRRVVYPKIK